MGDIHLLANLSLFYIRIDDKQVSQVDGDSMQSVINNAAEAHSQGIELNLKAEPVQQLTFFAGFGCSESKFDEFTSTEWNETMSALVQNDYKGNYLQYAPKYTYNLGFQYRHPAGLFAGGDIHGSDRFYGDYANRAEQSEAKKV